MGNTDETQAFLSPVVRQRIDDLLSGFYGGYIDKHTYSEIGTRLAEALESGGTLPEEVMLVVRRNGFSPFDRGVARRLAAEAIDLACGRSGMGWG